VDQLAADLQGQAAARQFALAAQVPKNGLAAFSLRTKAHGGPPREIIAHARGDGSPSCSVQQTTDLSTPKLLDAKTSRHTTFQPVLSKKIMLHQRPRATLCSALSGYVWREKLPNKPSAASMPLDLLTICLTRSRQGCRKKECVMPICCPPWAIIHLR